MPACVPVNNNNVGDVNGDVKPAGQSDSKLSKIISCLFLRKKTDVVDMTKESDAVAKKQKLSVDRSERSRRVLKMESLRTAPTSRDGTDTQAAVSQGQNQMFLPSESPTASFLSYLNPAVRRACSEVIRTNSAQSNNKLAREAFTESRRKIHTRNTNFRGQQASEKVIVKNSAKLQNGKPPKPPDRQSSLSKDVRKPIVVPGIMTSSEDDIGYDSDNEISDLHDEMRRMNFSQPDVKSAKNKHRRREGESPEETLSDEGSISLSEGSDVDQNEPENGERPQNPSPIDTRDKNKKDITKKRSMEDVIDNLFQQTQQNIDTIYKNGLESMDLETYRSDTITPDTYMKRLDEDVLKSQPDEHATAVPNQQKSASSAHESGNKQKEENQRQENNESNPHLDNLLTEVSIWAQDRQRWLLDGEGPSKDPNTRESTVASITTDGRAIEQVTQSNKSTCNEWVNGKSKPETPSKIKSESKTNGILTGPKLFRSTSKTPTSFHVGFEDKNQNAHGKDLQSNKTDGGLKIVDLGKEAGEENDLPDLEINGPYPEPWTSDMYTSTPRDETLDRSTICDDLSELDDKYHFRARSPDSWLSSTGSCSNLINKTVTSVSGANEGFEMSPPPSRETETPVKITASNIGKSHQIMRVTPKVHAPFRGLERQITPMPVEPTPIPTKPMLRNTQLKPLAVLRAAQQKSTIETFPNLPGRKSFSSYKGLSNMNDDGHAVSNQVLRPFSEIPLRTDMGDSDRNSSLLVHSSSGRESRDYHEQMGFTHTSLRPVSETMPAKRIDKIGVGNIMATKEKQKYARDVMNAMEKHRLQPQQGAFQENTSASVNEPLIEYDDDNNKEKETGRTRHKVFTNSLIRGGYNYDKHSRKRPSDQKDLKPPETDENINFTTSVRSKNNNPATRSVNDLSFSIRDSVDNPQSPRYKQNNHAQQQPMNNGDFQDMIASPRRTNVSQSFSIGSTQGDETKRGKHTSISQSFHNKYTAVQSHGLGVPPTHGLQLAQAPSSASHEQTANKFRQIRSRRDQEMDWLMRDAAETEV